MQNGLAVKNKRLTLRLPTCAKLNAMKPFAVFLPVLFCVSLFGCEKYEERVEQVVWRNDASCDLDVAVFADNGLWNLVLPQTGTVIGNS